MAESFSISPVARAELTTRLTRKNVGTGVCQFYFEHFDLASLGDDRRSHRAPEIGPLQRLLDEIDSASASGAPHVTRLEVGIFDLTEIPASQVRHISGILFQLDDYWYQQLHNFELDYDDGYFVIRAKPEPVRAAK